MHLLPLIDALQGALGLETLDLAFNRLTDAGVHVLLKALTAGAALELVKVHLVCTLHPLACRTPYHATCPYRCT